MKAAFKSFDKDFSVEKAQERFEAGEIPKDDFGGYSKEFYNPWNRVDTRVDIIKSYSEKAVQKASFDSQTGGAGTAGYAFVPVWPDPKVVDRTAKLYPFRLMVPRRAIRGLTYDYNALTAKGGANWRAENASIPIDTDTYDRFTIPVKFLYASGLLSGPVIAATTGFVDPKALDLGTKMTSIYEAEEEALINGDASTSVLEPSGCIKLIATNTTNRSGNYATLPLIRAERTTAFNAKGIITLAVTDASTHAYIKGLLTDQQRNIELAKENLGFGIPGSFGFDSILFIEDIFMPTTAAGKRILFLDMRYLFFAVLMEPTYEEVNTNQDGWKFRIKEYLTIALTHEATCTQMYGLA